MRTDDRNGSRVVAAVTTSVVLCAACGGEQAAVVGAPVSDEVADLTVVSDDQRVTAGAVCVADVPDDLSDCGGEEDVLASIELDPTRKGSLVVPADIASGGYRLEVGGAPLAGLDRVLDDQYQVFRVPVGVVERPGPTTLTVEALRTTDHPAAVWRFLLADPSEVAA